MTRSIEIERIPVSKPSPIGTEENKSGLGETKNKTKRAITIIHHFSFSSCNILFICFLIMKKKGIKNKNKISYFFFFFLAFFFAIFFLVYLLLKEVFLVFIDEVSSYCPNCNKVNWKSPNISKDHPV